MSIIANFLGAVLKFIFDIVHHYGFSIVIFTVIIKLILLPLTVKQTKSTQAMQDIQPKIKEIQGKYKKDPQKQNEEITKLYQESKINPMAGCLPLLIQMPILFGLFWVLRDPVKYHVFATALDFTNADTGFLWIKSLTKPDYIMAILSGASAFLMQKMTTPSEQMEGSMKTMLIVMTGMSFYWGFVFPAGLTIYWTASNIFQCAQYLLIVGPMKKKLANSKEVIIDAKKPGNKGKK